MMTKETRITVEFAAQALSLSLTAELALVGALISALLRTKALSLEDAATMLNDAADQIGSPLDRAPSDTQAIVLAPLRRHCDALRDLAKQLSTTRAT
jgi:hypothetical protein